MGSLVVNKPSIYEACIETVRDYLSGLIDFKTLSEDFSEQYYKLKLRDKSINEVQNSEELITLLHIEIAIADLQHSIECNATDYYNEDDLIVLLRSFVAVN